MRHKLGFVLQKEYAYAKLNQTKVRGTFYETMEFLYHQRNKAERLA
jgi:hypothetical protein